MSANDWIQVASIVFLLLIGLLRLHERDEARSELKRVKEALMHHNEPKP